MLISAVLLQMLEPISVGAPSIWDGGCPCQSQCVGDDVCYARCHMLVRYAPVQKIPPLFKMRRLLLYRVLPHLYLSRVLGDLGTGDTAASSDLLFGVT